MSKPYDASLKDLLTRRPEDWLPLVTNRTPIRVEVADTDVSKVTAATDKLIRVFDPDPWVFQIDFQSSYLTNLDARTHWYNASIGYSEGIPVVSLVVLLHRRADSSRWTGRYEVHDRDGQPYLDFRYRVIRAWELPLERVMNGGLGLLPLAMLTDEAQPSLPSVVSRIEQRFRSESDAGTAADLWAITGTLAGLRVDRGILTKLLRSLTQMDESSFVQWKLDEGSIREAKKIILFQAQDRFGEPDAATLNRLQSIEDLERLEDMARRLNRVADWKSLLAEPETVAP
jgi:predicted transposase YdaD